MPTNRRLSNPQPPEINRKGPYTQVEDRTRFLVLLHPYKALIKFQENALAVTHDYVFEKTGVVAGYIQLPDEDEHPPPRRKYFIHNELLSLVVG